MCKIGIYLVCNYPDRERFLDAAWLCEKYGVDFLEIGLPFSDPTADGDVIEKAGQDVLERYGFDDFVESAKRAGEVFSGRLYVMGYANLVFANGIDRFAERFGFVDGVILADVPFRESLRFKRVFERRGIGFVHFATPESRVDELKKIKELANDFIYFVSVRGTTGDKFHLDADAKRNLKVLSGSKHGVIVGFGVKSRDDIEEACRYADGVVIGTRAVESIKSGKFEIFLKNIAFY